MAVFKPLFFIVLKAAERPLCCRCFPRGHQASLPQSRPPRLSTLPGTLWAHFSVKPRIQDVHGHLKDAPKRQEAWGSSSGAAQPLAVVLRGCCAACEGLHPALLVAAASRGRRQSAWWHSQPAASPAFPTPSKVLISSGPQRLRALCSSNLETN